MKQGETSLKNKLERKTVEKNRRIRMKSLGFKLVSIIPDHHLHQPKEFLSHLDQIDEATAYIKILGARIEELKRRKAQLMNYIPNNVVGSKSPILTVKELGSDLEVVLISGLIKNFKISQVISIIQQEAAEVLTVNISRIGDNIFHTLHAQVKISRVGVDTSRIRDRIQELIS
ncbi:hypothetical protein C2S52_001771 [Perilla frutescens var. hirtella]|nr:hypothetical protein C2S51_006792 [Perilla frutescens var. frutescens]KAH6801307.1 hypothetical protein C2S52_001771 [Perilla frutescens var. hirtella]